MKTIIFSIFCFFTLQNSIAQQKYLTKSGTVTFFSHSPAEDIKAENKQVLSIVDAENGNIVIAILMKSFQFKKSLMQEHFNENYVESDTYPKATFTGDIVDYKGLEKGNQEIAIAGKLNIHGVTKQVVIKSTAEVSEDLLLKGTFNINLEDYDIEIPSVVKNNIAKSIKIDFNFNYKRYK